MVFETLNQTHICILYHCVYILNYKRVHNMDNNLNNMGMLKHIQLAQS